MNGGASTMRWSPKHFLGNHVRRASLTKKGRTSVGRRPSIPKFIGKPEPRQQSILNSGLSAKDEASEVKRIYATLSDDLGLFTVRTEARRSLGE